MTSSARLRSIAVLLALLVVSASFAIQAQSTAPKPITLDDYAKFKRITNAATSTDGKWMLYTVTPNEGDGTLVVKALDGDKTYDVPRGTNAAFSDDARWVGYFIAPPASSVRGGRGGRPRRRRACPVGRGECSRTNDAAPDLRGARTRERDEDHVSFGGQFRVLSGRRLAADAAARSQSASPEAPAGRGGRGAAPGAAAAGETAGPGADLLMRQLSTGTQRYIGKVGAYAFDEAGKQLAYTVRGEQRLGTAST